MTKDFILKEFDFIEVNYMSNLSLSLKNIDLFLNLCFERLYNPDSFDNFCNPQIFDNLVYIYQILRKEESKTSDFKAIELKKYCKDLMYLSLEYTKDWEI